MNRLLAAALLALTSLAGHGQTTLTPGSYTCTNCMITVLPVSPPASAASAPTIKVTGTPTGSITATSASIAWSATPAGTPVWCRRDAFQPGPCTANPFNLGIAPNAPLAAGPHTVDFYLTASPDITKPAAFHGAWTITAPSAPASSASSPASGAGGTTPPTTGALPALGASNQIINNYASGSWDGKSTVTASDAAKIVTYASAVDPLGSALVQLHRIHSDYANASLYGGARAEIAWQSTTMDIGKEYWIAFGFYLLPNEAGEGDSAHIIFQTHSQQGGNTTPDTYVQIWPAFGTMSIGIAYNANDPATWSYNGGSNGDTQGSVNLYGNDKGTSSPPAAAMPKPGTWTRVIMRKIPGYLASQGPVIQVWLSLANGPFVQVANYSGPNTYNTTSTIKPSLSTPQSYPRKGIYYFQTSSSTQWPMPTKTLAYYMTPLFFQQGAGLYANAVASLAPYGQ